MTRMARAGEGDVRAIIESDATLDLVPFIAAASALVDWVETCAVAKNKALTATQLRHIETWLAAHLYAHRDQLYTSKNTLRAGGSFQGQFGMRLDSTQYGQTAKLLDTSGCLAGLDKRQVAGASWLGKAKSDQIAYSDRD